MKTKVFLILFSFIVIAFSASADNTNPKADFLYSYRTSFFSSDISFLRTHRQGKGIEVNWGVTSTDGVSGFIVQKTYQDPNDPYSVWENVSSMSCNPSRSFKCNDEEVFPGYISYRVWIVMTNGSKTVSPASVVHIMSRHG
jgi:hypothetical protein